MTQVTRELRAKQPEIGLPEDAREADGTVTLEITDPGFQDFRDFRHFLAFRSPCLLRCQKGRPT